MPKKKSRRVTEVGLKKHQALQTGNSLQEAGEKMRSLHAEKFPVATGDKLVGTVEGRYPDRQAAKFGHDPAGTRVAESMTRRTFYCFEHQTVEEARAIMRENGLRHLPVVDGDLHIIGILALEEI
jgi:CBS domain-containing protein